jgi:hypothetical protein
MWHASTIQKVIHFQRPGPMSSIFARMVKASWENVR